MGLKFNNEGLLLSSLTHSSFSNEKSGMGASGNNERLEFLGDAVIGLVVAELLMSRYPSASEGRLSRWRSTLVSRKALADCAVALELQRYLRLGKGEDRSGGREKMSILAGAFEALVGAIYLDHGFERTAAFLQKNFEPHFLKLEEQGNALWRAFDRKTHLQERTQFLFKMTPNYRLASSWGLEHEKVFRVEIELNGKIIAEGTGRSKKEAEQSAADRALNYLEEST